MKILEVHGPAGPILDEDTKKDIKRIITLFVLATKVSPCSPAAIFNAWSNIMCSILAQSDYTAEEGVKILSTVA